MSERTDERLTTALEQLHDDERLTADLTDESAEVVFSWLENELRAAGKQDDARFAARVRDLRRGVKAAARRHADDPRALIAAAQSIASGMAAGLDDPSATPAGMRASPVSAAEPPSSRRSRKWQALSSRGPRRRRRRGWTGTRRGR